MTVPGSVAPRAALDGDDVTDLVDKICDLIVSRPGDIDAIAREETDRLAPLHDPVARAAIVRSVVARLTGLGSLDALLADPEVDEILVNGGSDVWVERHGALVPAGTLRSEQVEHLIERVLAPLGRRLDRSSPIVDARLPDGSRVCAVLPPIAVDGAALAIRRLATRSRPLTAFTDTAGEALVGTLLDAHLNLLVSGATSSGKTSFVGALLARCPASERLVVVEDTTELALDGHHVLRLETRPRSVDGPSPVDLDQLVRTALRLRPDRIIVGEIRGAEVIALLQALNTGHDGSLSTCHANGTFDALLRLESLVLQASPSWPLRAIRQQLARSLDAVVHLARHPDGRRRIVAVDQVELDPAGEHITLRPLAVADGRGGLDVITDPTRRR